jgi:hypothetical protein
MEISALGESLDGGLAKTLGALTRDADGAGYSICPVGREGSPGSAILWDD